jgi:hypothetical protein
MNIVSGKQPKARKVLLYGPEGIGKTSLARQFPRPLFLDTERGTGEYDVDRIEVLKWSDIVAALTSLAQQSRGYQTVVIDTIDSAAPLLVNKVCREMGISALGDLPFGKAYAQMSDQMDALIAQCNRLVDCGLHVLFLAHSQVRRMEQPDLPDGYDKYELRLPDRMAGPLKTAVDAVLFANFRVTMVEEKGRSRAMGGKERVLYATHSTVHDAKNRCGIPDKVPFTIESLAPLLSGLELEQTPPEDESKHSEGGPAPSLVHPLDAVIRGIDEAQLNVFLTKRGQITDGQTYRNLSEAYIRRVLSAPDEFREFVMS